MMNRIQLLSTQLANQIAAGEVVERPAAVLKELLENSLDADAHRIDIDIEKGGMQLIRVRDDGVGIHPDDLALALNRHATSKIYELNDLERITSLGFRGEALASISSVSQLTLTSCLRGQTDAWKITTDNNVTPAAHPHGTTVEVYDLFFNTPARRRFLRTEQTEFSHIEDLFKRMVLSHYQVGFTLRHNQKIIRQFLPATTERTRTQRAATIFGSGCMSNALVCEYEAAGMRLWGWVALPEFSRNYMDLQYCYVNNRTVRDKLINHAIRLAYQDALPPGRFPAYILYLELDPSVVDVNVHPTKHEVRFHESRQIHDFLFSSLRYALGQTPPNTILPLKTPSFVREPSTPPYTIKNTIDKNVIDKTILPLGYALSQLHTRYLLAENTEGLVIIDIPTARKLLTIAQLKQTVHAQPLLIPQSITTTENLVLCAEKNQGVLHSLGIEITSINPTTLLLRQIPSILKQSELSGFIITLLELLSNTLPSDIKTTAIHCIADHAAASIPPIFSMDDMNALLREVEQLPHSKENKFWRQFLLSALPSAR